MQGRYPREWVDELFARADIVQVVSSYLPLTKRGQRYWGLCPFHNEKTASFSVSGDMNLYHCFGCKAGGNVVQFVMEMERMTFA
ncbi:MAG TPA: DNA primase, partial [Clostridiales bacterium]|nr:DNA primase [Clostridiales bacterium]